MLMKGIILAGGKGTRLNPLNRITNKHLIRIFDQPMIEYPLNTLLRVGIRDILIISGREHAGQFIEYLGSGSERRASFTYKVQDKAGGIAQALLLAEDFAKREPIMVILGDNIFEDDFSRVVKAFDSGAGIFLKRVPDPERFGVAVLGKDKKVTRIMEKPKRPPTPYAVTGLYLYDSNVFGVIKRLKPSKRGELEITDVNNAYVGRSEMQARFVRGFWSDAGAFESLAKTSKWAEKQGKK